MEGLATLPWMTVPGRKVTPQYADHEQYKAMRNTLDELPAERLIFLVRKWVSKSDDAGVSFIAKIPDNHIRHMAPHLQFEPGVGVVMGSVRDGRFDEKGDLLSEAEDRHRLLVFVRIAAGLEDASAADALR